MFTNDKKSWKTSSNFWTQVAMIFTAAVMMVGGLFTGFTEELGQEVVAAVLGIFAAFKAVREWLKTKPDLDLEGAVNRSNFWDYVATVVIGLVPAIPGELIDSLEQLMQAIFGGSFQAILIAAFSLLTIIYNTFIRKNVLKEAK